MEIPEDKAIQQSVLDAIASGRVKMRSRSYFVLQTILAIVGGVILGLFLIYIVGFMIFLLRQSGVLLAPGLGFSGWYIFFRSLPWLLIVLSLIFLLVLVVLINHYAFAYQRPLLYSLLGILIIVTAASFFVSFTALNPPILGTYYSGYDAGEIPDVHRGEIVVLAANGFVLQGLSGETSTVLFGAGMSPAAENILRAGDLVVVFGDRDASGFIEASAIEKL
jgi:hypothetical protein